MLPIQLERTMNRPEAFWRAVEELEKIIATSRLYEMKLEILSQLVFLTPHPKDENGNYIPVMKKDITWTNLDGSSYHA